MTCANPKTYQNQKFFWIPSNQPPNTHRMGWVFIYKNMFWWDTLLRIYNRTSPLEELLSELTMTHSEISIRHSVILLDLYLRHPVWYIPICSVQFYVILDLSDVENGLSRFLERE